MSDDTGQGPGIVPIYAWLEGEYKPVWRVFINGHQVGVWTKRRWAERDLRQHMRSARRTARRG